MSQRIGAFFRFFISRQFLINFVLAVVLFFGTGYLLLNWLDGYTNHGQQIRVPNLVGLPENEVKGILDPLGLKYELDSVYVADATPGTIYSQDPLPTDCTGVFAKEERTIYVTMIRYTPPGKFLDPDKYIGHSKREVGEKLRSLGFKVVEKFEPHPDNFVLDVKHKGKAINPEVQIPVGETITIVVGNGRKVAVTVPDLIDKTISDARRSLGNIPLELIPMECIGCRTSEDTANARIVRQDPAGGPDATAAAGSDLMIWLSVNPKIEEEDQE
jgi:hypothetical protein